MGSLFLVYLQLGARHIADLRGYDHILFVAALALAFTPAQWRRLLLLVTAFTLGHSLTLALATLRLVEVSASWVEFLIPVTIAATALGTMRQVVTADGAGVDEAASDALRFRLRYAAAAGFGLIHGLGFSNFLRAALGAEESIGVPLFAFNVGLECGQLAIVAVVLLLGTLLTRMLGVPRRWWIGGAASGILAASLGMAWARWPR